MYIEIAGLTAWAVCGVLAYGFTFAFLQRGWPASAKENATGDWLLAMVTGAIGPYGLLIILLYGGFRHGLKWTASKERKE